MLLERNSNFLILYPKGEIYEIFYDFMKNKLFNTIYDISNKLMELIFDNVPTSAKYK